MSSGGYGSGLFTWIAMALLVAGAALWWRGMQAHEIAVRHARDACARQSLQFLDQTVALRRIRMSRQPGGQVGLDRDYRFEFTLDGRERIEGGVRLRGQRLQGVWFPFTANEQGERIMLH